MGFFSRIASNTRDYTADQIYNNSLQQVNDSADTSPESSKKRFF